MTASAASAAPAPTSSTTYYGSCPPILATPRNLARPTLGGRTANLAKLLGTPLDHWQHAVANVLGELEPSGRLAYPVAVLIVPRRAGKTLLTFLHSLAILTAEPRARGWYTLHRREIGAALWRDELFPLLGASQLGRLVRLRRSNGSESVTMRRGGSTLRLFAPSGEALRSQNANVVVVDEAREFTLEAGARLEAAVRPAQARRPSRQLVLVSSAPGPAAPAEWLRKYRDLGRAAVLEERTNGVAYFEWSAPLELDWRDPATWAVAHPAIAAGQITADALAPDLETMDPATFRAEYLGHWWEEAGPRTLDPEGWAAGAGEHRLDELGAWSVALDISGDRGRAAIAVAGRLPDGRVHGELVATGAGATWALDTAAGLVEAHRGARLVVDNYGPAANMLTLARARLGESRVVELDTGAAARACATLLDLCAERRLSHRGQAELEAALAEALARPRGDGWLWDRRTTAPEVCAFTWAAATAGAPAGPRPMVASSRPR